ncbi:hypothetical protein ACFL47_08810 [Candidatus Latescibacterota bacterium]
MKRLLPVLMVCMFAFTHASGEKITGKITVPTRTKAKASRSYSRGVFEPKLKTDTQENAPGDSLIVVVWAEPIGTASPFVEPDEKPLMNQKNKMFVPDVLVIQTGTTVGFPNLDPLYHNVFSYSKTKRFDLGRYPQGSSKEVTFNDEGLVEVFCEIHDHMHAYIIVVNTPYFTQADRDGNYTLEVPSGKYRLLVWSPKDAGEVDLTGSSKVVRDVSF